MLLINRFQSSGPFLSRWCGRCTANLSRKRSACRVARSRCSWLTGRPGAKVTRTGGGRRAAFSPGSATQVRMPSMLVGLGAATKVRWRGKQKPQQGAFQISKKLPATRCRSCWKQQKTQSTCHAGQTRNPIADGPAAHFGRCRSTLTCLFIFCVCREVCYVVCRFF